MPLKHIVCITEGFPTRETGLPLLTKETPRHPGIKHSRFAQSDFQYPVSNPPKHPLLSAAIFVLSENSMNMKLEPQG